jgi:hypothetical protein
MIGPMTDEVAVAPGDGAAAAVPTTKGAARAASMVRVLNLGDDTDESALRTLLAAFGPVGSIVFRQTASEGSVAHTRTGTPRAAAAAPCC